MAVPPPLPPTDSLLPLQFSDSLRSALRPVLVATWLGAAVVLVLSWPVSLPHERAVLLLFVGAAAAVHRLVHIGWTVLAGALAVGTLLAAAVLLVATYGSLRSIASLLFVVTVIVSGIFNGRRGLVTVTAVSTLLIVGLAYAEMTGRLTSIERPMFWSYPFIFATVLIGVALVMHYARSVALAASAQVQAELAERRQAEARLELSMEVARQGWFDLDLVTGAVRSSAHFARMVGADPAAHRMTQETWLASIHPADRAAVLAAFDECLRTGETRQMDYRMRVISGEVKWIRSIAKVVGWDDNGRPRSMTGTHTDITEQMRVMLALQESERRYREMVDLSPVGSLVHRDGRILYANPAAITMLGAPRVDAVLETPLLELAIPAHRAIMADLWRADTRRELSSAAVELQLRRYDGRAFDVSVQRAGILFEGEPAVQLSFTDISDRKQADETRLRSRQLEALGTLAGGIAHDFNNIILAIRGNAEIAVRDVGVGHAASESLRDIVLASSRASELVRRITAFGRPKELQRNQVALVAIIEEVLRLLRPTIPAGITVDLTVDGAVSDVYADAAQVHEALVNLAANAVYAIGYGRIGRIEFRVDEIAVAPHVAPSVGVRPGRYARITVADDGSGMDAETMARIFDVFYTTKPVGDGTGLGLSMVYGIMKGHGGSVQVDSAPGQGARFAMYFPVVATPRRPELPPSVVAPAAPAGRRVLFVDDERQLVTLAERVLSREGHVVLAFTDPLRALETFRERPQDFDVLVTDLTMPRMSGLELARAVQEIRADIPIVMATGYAEGVDEAAVKAAGIRHLAVKASEPQQFTSLIDHAFRDH